MKRPLSVTIVGWLFIAAGVTGIIYHAPEWKAAGMQAEAILAFVVRVVAIVGGIFTLKGSNFARWVLVIWILYHVVLSFYHSTMELLTHIAFTVVVLLGLFNTRANQFFKEGSKT